MKTRLLGEDYSAWASAQSGQSLHCPHEERLNSLRWAHSYFVGFVMQWLLMSYYTGF